MSNSPSSSTNPSTALPAGARAPDFQLSATPEKTLALKDLRGKPVVLAFYPADWSPVCGDQLALYNEILPEFTAQGAQLIGISVDGMWCHKAYSESRDLQFPLLADFEPKGAVARQYGVYQENGGVCQRALFVIDRAGIIRWSYVSPPEINPGADGILRELEKLPAREPS